MRREWERDREGGRERGEGERDEERETNEREKEERGERDDRVSRSGFVYSNKSLLPLPDICNLWKA